MRPGSKPICADDQWRQLSGKDRALALLATMLMHEGGAPPVSMRVTEREMRFDVRHLYHRSSGAEGPRLVNIRKRLFVLFPALNGVDVIRFDPAGPHLVVVRDAVDWDRALEDWARAGAVGTVRTGTEVHV